MFKRKYFIFLFISKKKTFRNSRKRTSKGVQLPPQLNNGEKEKQTFLFIQKWKMAPKDFDSRHKISDVRRRKNTSRDTKTTPARHKGAKYIQGHVVWCPLFLVYREECGAVLLYQFSFFKAHKNKHFW